MRDVNSKLISEMIIQIDNAPNGAFFMAIPKSVKGGIYFADVQFVQEGVIRHSDIFRINIKETVTWQD